MSSCTHTSAAPTINKCTSYYTQTEISRCLSFSAFYLVVCLFSVRSCCLWLNWIDTGDNISVIYSCSTVASNQSSFDPLIIKNYIQILWSFDIIKRGYQSISDPLMFFCYLPIKWVMSSNFRDIRNECGRKKSGGNAYNSKIKHSLSSILFLYSWMALECWQLCFGAWEKATSGFYKKWHECCLLFFIQIHFLRFSSSLNYSKSRFQCPEALFH